MASFVSNSFNKAHAQIGIPNTFGLLLGMSTGDVPRLDVLESIKRFLGLKKNEHEHNDLTHLSDDTRGARGASPAAASVGRSDGRTEHRDPRGGTTLTTLKLHVKGLGQGQGGEEGLRVAEWPSEGGRATGKVLKDEETRDFF